jgi:hypothetical protein
VGRVAEAMVRYKFGISGPWWYASGATIQSE